MKPPLNVRKWQILLRPRSLWSGAVLRTPRSCDLRFPLDGLEIGSECSTPYHLSIYFKSYVWFFILIANKIPILQKYWRFVTKCSLKTLTKPASWTWIQCFWKSTDAINTWESAFLFYLPLPKQKHRISLKRTKKTHLPKFLLLKTYLNSVLTILFLNSGVTWI